MSDFFFTLEKFHISKTRSRFNDTDVVTFGLKVGNQMFQPLTQGMGDIGDGEYLVSMRFGPIDVQPNDTVVLDYIIVNCGYETSGQGTLKEVTDSLSDAAADVVNNWLPGLGTLGNYITHKLHNVFYADCDGVVASDIIIKNTPLPGQPIILLTGSDLTDRTARVGVYSETRSYPGTDSPVGCGENSLYFVTWSISRPGAWSGEEDLGGILTSDPAVTAWGPNRLDCFYRGQNNHMWHRWWDGNAWSGEEDLGGILTSDPAVAAWGPNRLDCFYRGQNNHIWHRWWDGNAWSGEEDLGGELVSAPTVAAWGPNRLDCFYRGQNDHLLHRWFPVW